MCNCDLEFWKLPENFQKDIDTTPLLGSSRKKNPEKPQPPTEDCCLETEKFSLTAPNRNRFLRKTFKVSLRGYLLEKLCYLVIDPCKQEKDHSHSKGCVGGPLQYALIIER